MGKFAFTFFVAEQVLVNSEGGFDRTIFLDLLANVVHVARNGIRTFAEMLVVVIVDAVAQLTMFIALRCFATFSVARRTRSVHMMFARLDFVRATALARSVGAAADQAFLDPIAPGSTWETTVTFVAISGPSPEQSVKRMTNAHPLQPKPHV